MEKSKSNKIVDVEYKIQLILKPREISFDEGTMLNKGFCRKNIGGNFENK